MEEKYRIVYKQKENLYIESAPLIIKAGALVLDREKRRLFAQIKFANITDKEIVLLTAKVVLMDSVGREIGEIEKKYLDVNRNYPHKKVFGEKTPIIIEENTTRKIAVYVTEVCFADGSIWSSEGKEWEEIPKPKTINEKVNSPETLEEYKETICARARVSFMRHKDLWICSCGAINKEDKKVCKVCSAHADVMENVDVVALHRESVYKKANKLITSRSSTKIQEGIVLLESLSSYKDSEELLSSAKEELETVKESEALAKKERKKRKKRIAILASVLSVVLVIIILFIAVATDNARRDKYIEAKAFLQADEYTKAYDKFTELGDYSDSQKLADYAYNMKERNFKEILENDPLINKFVIPSKIDGVAVTMINAGEFEDCEFIGKIVIPASVTSIGGSAFKNCGVTEITFEKGSKLATISASAFQKSWIESIDIPDSVTTIGASAFEWCSFLEEVNFTESSKLTKIGNNAFRYTKIQSIDIPSGVTSIGDACFSSTDITSVVLPDGIKTINKNTFYLSDLKSIILPSSVTRIESGALNSSNLESVYFKGTQAQWDEITIESLNSKLESATICCGFDGKSHDYTLIRNDGSPNTYTTSDKEIDLPNLTKTNMHFVGWYDNQSMTGPVYKDKYYSSTKTTLYAKWLTQEEYNQLKDGTSFEKAYTVTTGSHTANITTAGGKVYYKFVPTTSKSYTIKSIGGKDTYGELYNSSKIKLTYNDGTSDFSMSYYMSAGQTYYIVVKFYSSSATGSFTVQIS